MEETEIPLKNPQDIQSQVQSMMEFQKKGKVTKPTINTKHILFIVSGSFDGLAPIIEKRLRKSVQSVHTVRFNPFKGTGGGGNQSFATSFLNEEGDGVVLSSIYSRDRVSIFAKPVKKHSSEYELSEEEKEAVSHSQKQ